MEQSLDIVKQVEDGKEILVVEQASVLNESGSSLSEELTPVIQQIINIALTVPLIHPDKFAEQVGRSSGVIGGWLDSGYLPTIKVGRYQMINLALLTENLKKGFVL